MTDITFATVALPDAYDGIPYEAAVAPKGFATAISAGSISSGSLPPGLTLNSTDHLRITGTVTGVDAGLPKTYTFKVTLTDGAGAVQSGNLTITVRDASHASEASGGGFGSLPVAAQMAQMWPLTQS